MKKDLIIIGAGGHGRVVAEAALLSGKYNVLGFIDRDPDLTGQSIIGLPILGNHSFLPSFEGKLFIVAIGSIADTTIRRQVFERTLDRGLIPASVIHPDATVSSFAEIGPGTAVLAGAVINASAKTGTSAIVNTRAVLEHDSILGDHAHLAPGAIVCGAATISNGCHIGAGAVVLQLVTVGECATVGAGAVVTRDVAPNRTVIGVPAKVLGAPTSFTAAVVTQKA